MSNINNISGKQLKKPHFLKEDKEEKPTFRIYEKPLNSMRN